jgi:peroxiredoxin Q/BCP
VSRGPRSPSPLTLALVRAFEGLRGLAGRYDRDGGPRMLEPGDEAPDFAVKDHTGRTVRLSDYKGKDVVLWFYPRANTPG